MSNKALFNTFGLKPISEQKINRNDILEVDGIEYSIAPHYVRPSANEPSPFEIQRQQEHAFSGKKFTAGQNVDTMPTKNGGFVAISATFAQNHQDALGLKAARDQTDEDKKTQRGRK